MPHWSRIALPVLLVAGGLAACGDDPATPGSTAGIPSTSGTTATRASYPITIQRIGGVAGFRDQLSVAQGGAVTGTTKGGEVTCALAQDALATLDAAARGIAGSDRPSVAPSTTVSDAMTVLVGAGGGLVRLDDPRMASAADVVNALLADVTKGGAGTVCT